MIRGILKIGYYAIFLAIVTLALLLIISIFPVPGNYQVKVVLSGSMEPDIMIGSIVIIKPAKIYDVGDVITFGKDNKSEVPVTHRIIERKEEFGVVSYITKGDANKSGDPGEVKQNEIIGKVLFDVPHIGYILDFAKKPKGFFVLVIIPAALIALGEISKIIREIRRIYIKKHTEA